MDSYVLRVVDVCKTYTNQEVLNNININVNKGQIYGFLGKNGAGKTTTIKIIMGLLNYSRGHIEILGNKVKKGDIGYLDKIGSVIEYPIFYENLTAYDNMKLHMIYSGMNFSEGLMDKYLNLLRIGDAKFKKVKEFSLGMKQRLGIARALMHSPEILILDEPTNGLDPKGIKEFREFIKDIAYKENITVIISSHILSEIQILADKIGIINNGTIIEEIEMDKLESKLRSYLVIKTEDNCKCKNIIEKEWPNLRLELHDDSLQVLDIKKAGVCSYQINNLLIKSNTKVSEIYMVSENLEDYFLRITGGEKW